MLRITHGRGFALVFANGWTVSIQFGPGNYCENRNADYNQSATVGEKGSRDAEIAAWPGPSNGRDTMPMVSFGGDTVKGYCNADEVAAFIALVAGLPSGDCKNFAEQYDSATQHIQR